MDEVDHTILQILKQNARTTNNDIAGKVKLSEGAVRIRIKHLLESGVIKRFTIQTEEEGQAEAIVLIRTQTKGSKEILRRIRQHANRLFETAGEYDVAAYLVAGNIQNINSLVDRLRNVNGVVSTVTLLKIADDRDSGA